MVGHFTLGPTETVKDLITKRNKQGGEYFSDHGDIFSIKSRARRRFDSFRCIACLFFFGILGTHSVSLNPFHFALAHFSY